MRWSEIPEFPDYEVNEEGVVYNLYRGQPIKQQLNKSGVAYVCLYRDRVLNTRAIAPIVASLFLEPPISKRFNTPIHLNGDRTDNRASNLMWRPRWFAVKYHQQFTRPHSPYRMIIHLSETGETFNHPMEAVVKYGLLERSIIVDVVNQDGVFPYNFHFWA